MKRLIYNTNILSFYLTILISCQLIEKKVDLDATDYYIGLYIRSISTSEIYAGNLIQDTIINLQTGMSSKFETKVMSVTGSFCPLIFKTSFATYVISQVGKEYLIQNNKNDQKVSVPSDGKVMSLELSKNNWFIIVEMGLSVKKVQLDGRTESLSWTDSNYIGGFVMSNGNIILFSYFSGFFSERFDYAILNPYSFGPIQWITIPNKPKENQYGYYQTIELKNKKLITCYLSLNKIKVGCFTGTYTADSFTLSEPMTDLIFDCNEQSYFYLYNFGNNYGIIGCGSKILKIAKIDGDLQIIGPIIEVAIPNIYSASFSTHGNYGLHFFYSKYIDNKYYYYTSQFYFPHCVDVKFILLFTDTFQIEHLFTHSFETTNNHEIKIISDVNNGMIYDNDETVITLKEVYPLKDLTYKPLQSSYEIFKFKGVDTLSFPPNIWESEECTATLVICFETCNSCSLPGTSNKQNCLSCDNQNYFRKENDDSNCYDVSILEQGYYFDVNALLFKKCHKSCKTCFEFGDDIDSKCSKCDILNDYYPTFDQPSICKLNNGNNSGWVLQNGFFHRCYESCKTCSKTKDDKNHGCDECKEGYMISPIIPKSCVPNCDLNRSTWYYGVNYEFFCLNSTECIGEYPFLIPQTNQCVSTCKDLYTCQFCIDNQPLYEYNDQCVKELME